MLKKTLLAATLAALCTPLMAGYYLIVPVATRTPGPVEIPIVVRLGVVTLPAGAEGVPYQGYDFNQALQLISSSP